jgi:hypothetical protein
LNAEPIAGDRRQWGIYLTGQARQLLVKVEWVVQDNRTDMLHGLSEAQQKPLSELLQAVKLNLFNALELDRSQLHDHGPEDQRS